MLTNFTNDKILFANNQFPKIKIEIINTKHTKIYIRMYFGSIIVFILLYFLSFGIIYQVHHLLNFCLAK